MPAPDAVRVDAGRVLQQARQRTRRERLRRYLDIVLAIAGKDIRSEARRSEILAPWVTYGLLLLAVLATTTNLRALELENVGASLIWMSFVLIGAMGLNHSFSYERSDGGWEALLMVPVDHSALFFGKFLSNLLFTFIAESAVLLGFALFYSFPYNVPALVLATFLGTIGFVSIGTLLAAFTTATPSKELLLPIMLLPIVVPVIAVASGLMSGAFAGAVDSDWTIMIVFLVGYDLILLAAAAAASSFIGEMY